MESKDEVEAVRLYRLAAGQGLSSAKKNLGVCYHKGVGVSHVDMREATRLYRAAAVQGHAAAQGILGWCHLQGNVGGVKRDELEAARLFRLSYECLTHSLIMR